LAHLLNRPEIFEDESVEGYLYRLAKVNYLEFGDLDFDKIRFFRADDVLESMKQFISHAEILSQQRCRIEQLIYYRYSQGFVLPGWRTRNHSRFCPLCMRENAYHRLIWCISYFTYCKRHSTTMKEHCYSCNRKTTVSGVINDRCDSCGASLSLSSSELIIGEELPFSSIKNYTVGKSPTLQEFLTAEEQLLLTQRIAYYLCTRTNTFSLSLNTTEKTQLAQNGYFADINMLRKIFSRSQELLKQWPTNLILFLKNHYKDFNESREVFKIIATLENESINKLLSKTIYREDLLKSYNIFCMEHLLIDGEYINVIDFAENRGMCLAIVKKIMDEHSINTEIHPRNFKRIIHESWVDFISEKVGDYKINYEFISIGTVADLWGRTEEVAKGLCNYFKLKKKVLFSEPCYEKARVIQMESKAAEYITLWEVGQSKIWDLSTIKKFLQRSDVIVLQESEGWYSIYCRNSVTEALKGLSEDIGDYYDRTDTINQLGIELFKVAFLNVYYRLEKPYYLKTEVKAVLNLFKELKSLHEVEKIRRSLIWESLG
jgi:hypothetical protein